MKGRNKHKKDGNEVSADQLQQAVEGLHGCKAKLLETVPVTEVFEGAPAWEGMVHIFGLKGHPSAKKAYAWSSPIEGSEKRRFFAVLHAPPVTSPAEAVRAAIIQEYRTEIRSKGEAGK